MSGVFLSIIAVIVGRSSFPEVLPCIFSVPWKPVVLVWGLLSAMIFFGFVASSVLKGQDPFAPGATVTQPSAVKVGAAQAGQQPKHTHKAAKTPSQ
jgi:hypothetical protein